VVSQGTTTSRPAPLPAKPRNLVQQRPARHQELLSPFRQNLGTVNFSASSANGKAINNSAWSYDPLTMVTSGLQVKAAPSGLDSTGSAFSVTWAHN
jgi:hypothetical protein